MASAFQSDAFQTSAFQSTTTVSSSFTADAILKAAISGSLTADAVLLKTQSGSFTVDAVLDTAAGTHSGSFTADSILLAVQSGSFSGDSVLKKTISSSISGDSVLKKTQSGSFTANAIKRITVSGSKTADAILRKTTSRSFSADSYIIYNRMRHNRWTEHTGIDRDSDHVLAQAFGVYLKDENMEAVLAELDARITAREQGYRHNLQRLYANAIIKGTRSGSLSTDARLRIVHSGSFTADAVKQLGFRADAWIFDPTIYIEDDVTIAPDWGISTTAKAAIISTASLTHDAVNDPPWWDTDYLSGWAKFTLTATHTVRLDTINTQGDSVLELWSGSPGSWPSDPIAYSDDDVDDPTNPYGASELIEQSLAAGTYYVLVHPYQEPPSPDFNILLRMQITA